MISNNEQFITWFSISNRFGLRFVVSFKNLKLCVHQIYFVCKGFLHAVISILSDKALRARYNMKKKIVIKNRYVR